MKIKNDKSNVNKARDTGLAIVLLILIVTYFTKHHNLVQLAIIVLILSILWPKLFSPIVKIWFGFSNVVGTIMSKFLLSVVFYVVVTPTGMIRRLFKADPLQLKDWKKGNSSVLTIRNQTIKAKDLEKPYWLALCIFSSRRHNMDFIRDLWGFMRVRKKYWLLPIIIILVLLGTLIVLTSGSAIAPFIYTLF